MGEAKAKAEAAAARLSEPCCASCKHSLASGENIVTCLRNPPAVTVVRYQLRPDPKGGVSYMEAMDFASHFPQMQATGICGEWRTKLIGLN